MPGNRRLCRLGQRGETKIRQAPALQCCCSFHELFCLHVHAKTESRAARAPPFRVCQNRTSRHNALHVQNRLIQLYVPWDNISTAYLLSSLMLLFGGTVERSNLGAIIFIKPRLPLETGCCNYVRLRILIGRSPDLELLAAWRPAWQLSLPLRQVMKAWAIDFLVKPLSSERFGKSTSPKP